MATPKVVTDNSSDLDEAVLNKFLSCPKSEVKVNYCSIDFNAGTNTPTVSAGRDSDGEIVTGDLSWDAGDTEIDIVLTGFTALPLCFVCIIASGNASTNVGGVHASASAAALAHIRFVGTGAGSTAVDPDGNMTVQLLVIGV